MLQLETLIPDMQTQAQMDIKIA